MSQLEPLRKWILVTAVVAGVGMAAMCVVNLIDGNYPLAFVYGVMAIVDWMQVYVWWNPEPVAGRPMVAVKSIEPDFYRWLAVSVNGVAVIAAGILLGVSLVSGDWVRSIFYGAVMGVTARITWTGITVGSYKDRRRKGQGEE